MRRALGLALLVGGLLLIYFGFQESGSLASDVSEAVTGSPTDRSMWMLVVGAVVAIFGGILTIMPSDR